MTGFTNPTIGDAILAQFVTEIEQLERELHQLKMGKRGALAGQKDFAVVRRVDTRVEKLARNFERHRDTFEMLFAGADPADLRIAKLRAAIRQLEKRIADLLAMSQPDRGKGSVGKIVQQHREKMLKTQKVVGSASGPTQPGIQLPGMPGGLAADPVLALAILIDVLRQLVLGKDKKK